MIEEDSFEKFKKIISKENGIVKELNSLFNYFKDVKNIEEKKMVSFQITSLKNSLRETNESIAKALGGISLAKPLYSQEKPSEKNIEQKESEFPKSSIKKNKLMNGITLSELEKETLKRLKRKEKKIIERKLKKPNKYVKISNRVFSNFSRSLLDKKIFLTLKRDLIKTNLQFIPASYISVILFTTLFSAIIGLFVFLFFLFFNLGAELPIISLVTENIWIRLLKVFWILFAIPIGTFLIMYFYPSVEKKFAEGKINQELPFATIHMASISNSMVEPSKIFSIIISTNEYPYLEKEFTKLMNEINIYGYDLVSALRNVAFNSPSAKLTELFKGLATTINSGGDLPGFFDKRAQSLLFEYRLEREKYTKFAETFMDIYISVVIAAPMILMLLLIMMKISGLGISLSTSLITLIMVLGVSIINIVFLTFLHLKQPSE